MVQICFFIGLWSRQKLTRTQYLCLSASTTLVCVSIICNRMVLGALKFGCALCNQLREAHTHPSLFWGMLNCCVPTGVNFNLTLFPGGWCQWQISYIHIWTWEYSSINGVCLILQTLYLLWKQQYLTLFFMLIVPLLGWLPHMGSLLGHHLLWALFCVFPLCLIWCRPLLFRMLLFYILV